MELKGDLKRNGLPSLFRNFANEHFHGVLTITSPVGEKLITLTENEVTIYCDDLNESSKLGNILLGRSLVTEETLEQALRDQKKLEPRPKLGDLLVQRGLVPEKAISDARRFQIEEDICDILAWKSATFTFAGADSAREIHPEDFAADQVHRLTIDPDTFFKYVTKVTEDWDSIGDRLPTQYLCFKLSSKVNESLSKLTSEGQRVLRFLKEGRTVEGAVKQSCVGRIQVCVHVIDFLEKGLVLPASGAELRFLASEHRAQKRYHDALYIYRRLLESPDSQDDRPYLENLIEEISETIVRLKQRGEYGEEAIIVSHKDAKVRYLKKQSRRNLFWWAFGLSGIIALGLLLINSAKPPDNLSQRYREIITRVDTLVASGKFNAAIRELDDLYDTMTDKESHAAISIQEKKAHMSGLIRNYVESRATELNEQLQHGAEFRGKALAGLHELLEEYPGSPSEQKIKDLIAKYEIEKVNPPSTDPIPNAAFAAREELLERVHKAESLKQLKKFSEAGREFVSVAQESPANGDIWKLANEGAKAIKEIEQHAADAVKQAENAWAERKGDTALELIDQAVLGFGDLEGLANAEALKTRWLSHKSTAQQVFKTAKDLEDQKSYFEAKVRYEQVARNYPEFPIAAEASKKLDVLKIKCDALLKTIEAALEQVKIGQFKKARDIYRPLLEFNQPLLIDQHVEIPVNITSIPDNSILRLNGRLMGKTPKNVMIPAGEQFEILVERPGFSSRRVASDRLTVQNLEISVRLELEPIVIDFPAPPLQPATPLLAPPAWFENRLLVLNGPDLVALDPPKKEIQWTVPDLYDPHAALPDSAQGDDKYFWNFRVAPYSYKPGFVLLPTRNRELLELDLRNPEKPRKRSLLARLGTPPPEIVGAPYVEEHSKLAGESLLVAAFADGMVRCYLDFDKNNANLNEKWALPLDSKETVRHEPPAAGLYGYKGSIWVLSSGGTLQAFDPIENAPIYKRQFGNMSPRSTFAAAPGDPLAAFILRNGQVTLFDLDRREEVWSLPPRQAMEESVGVLIDDAAVFVTVRKDDYGELAKYPRIADAGASAPKPLCSIKLDGYVNLDMTRGKNIYLITHFNKVLAYSKKDLTTLWEFKIKPELGEPRSIRAFGDYVYVATDKGKLIVLKSE